MDQTIVDSLQPTTLVIFGITGDLVRRKLLPALYYLAKNELLPRTFKIVGVSRREITAAMLIDSVRMSIEATGNTCDETALAALAKHFEVHIMDVARAEDYVKLNAHLDALENETGVCMNRLFYLAIPAQLFSQIIKLLGGGGLNKSCQHKQGDARLLIEKPFGYDSTSARELIDDIGEYFKEDQVYRIDHYLAKETAQNILVFRFKNPIFKQIWNSSSIRRIHITAAESIGIEGRGAFYEQTGALRDLIQSHLMQLLALVTMDEPTKMESAAVHVQKLALLKSITPIAPNEVAEHAVRAQYEGYREEVQNAESITETYASLKLAIDSDRWRGVEVELTSGKAMAEKSVEIDIHFADPDDEKHMNILKFRIQPNEGIGLQLLAKKPGFTDHSEAVEMDFNYKDSFTTGNHPDPYERVIMDAFRGDQTLFATSEEVLTCWRIVESVVQEWAKNDSGLRFYKTGSSNLE